MIRKGVLSELEESIVDVWKTSDAENGLLVCNVLAVREYGLEKDVKDFLDSHPNISFMELDEYITSLCPPIEIVDDEDLDNDD